MTEILCFAIGLTLICGVSLWDDIASLPNKIRIVVHFLSIGFVFYGLGIFGLWPWWSIGLAFVLFVGIMNAYNFMDGVNGMTGLYSLAILISLLYVNYRVIRFTPPDFIVYAILACLVFLFFNFRKRAKCFAGDVGSLGISFWIVVLLLQLMLRTESMAWIFFLGVYGTDTICTILHRLYLRQNIFEAHRMHFYQILSNEKGISHLKVAAGYALVQLSVCIIIIYVFEYHNAWTWITGLTIIVFLSFLYLLKFKIIR